MVAEMVVRTVSMSWHTIIIYFPCSFVLPWAIWSLISHIDFFLKRQKKSITVETHIFFCPCLAKSISRRQVCVCVCARCVINCVWISRAGVMFLVTVDSVQRGGWGAVWINWLPGQWAGHFSPQVANTAVWLKHLNRIASVKKRKKKKMTSVRQVQSLHNTT